MIDKNLIRKEYSFLDGNDKLLFNTSMLGIPPLRTQAASRAFIDGYVEYTMGIDEDRYSDVRSAVKSQLAQLLNASPDEIAFVKNATEGTSILASGYELGPGDNVVSCDIENQANLFPWFNNARRRGYELRVLKTSRGRTPVDEIFSMVDEHTKIVSLSTVQANTGYFADFREISRRCHNQGIILAMDATQAMGRLDIDVKELGADYLSCSCFKGMLSGLGTGFMWCRPELFQRITPPYCGFISAGPYMSAPKVTSGDIDFHLADDTNRFEAGTMNMHGISLMESSLSLILELGISNINDYILSLEKELRAALADTAFDVLTPECEDRMGGIVVLYYPEEFHQRVDEALNAHNVYVTHHRGGYIRIGIGMHNTSEDCARLAEILKSISKNVLEV